MAEPYQRARSAAHKRDRRAAILAAAERLVERHGAQAVTMAALAEEAGLVKSAFYRYFQSREELLAYVLIEQAEAITEPLARAAADSADLAAFAPAYARLCAARPVFCELSSQLRQTLETNIAQPRLVAIKTELARLANEWVERLCVAGVAESPAQGFFFVRSSYVLMSGLWPMTRARPAALARAADEAGVQHGFEDFEQEFAALLACLARGWRG